MRRLVFIATTISLALFSGCAIYKYHAKYAVSLESGAEKLASGASTFEDESIKIDFRVSETQVNFTLKNKTSSTIKVIWDESAFVSSSGETHRVFHSGIKFNEKENSQPPSIVISGGTLTDLVAPADYAHYTKTGGWDSLDLIPLPTLIKDDPERDTALTAKGKSAFRVLLTLDIEGKRKEYLFPFLISDVVFIDAAEAAKDAPHMRPGPGW